MSTPWIVDITFTDQDDETTAVAELAGDGVSLSGIGRARRNPSDPAVPVIGEEIAAGRALGDLAHALIERAAGLIEAREGPGVRVHS